MRLKAIGFVAIRIHPEFRQQNAKVCKFLYVLSNWSFKSVGRKKNNIFKKLDNFKGSFKIQSAPFLRFRAVFRGSVMLDRSI